MNVLAILKDFTCRCKSVFENITTKMSKRFLNWLILTIRTVALIPGKINFTRLSRYGGRKKKYGEKLDLSSLDMSVFTSCIYTDSKGTKTEFHTAVVNSRTLKRDIRIAV